MPIQVKDPNPRPLWPALGRGMRGKCPACGKGKLFHAYLKVNQGCAVCGEELHHHRADDLPPYLAIVIVGHVLVAAMIELEMGLHIASTQYLVYLLPLAIIMPLAILPPIKGGVVALQWALKMHGFGDTHSDPARPEPEPLAHKHNEGRTEQA